MLRSEAIVRVDRLYIASKEISEVGSFRPVATTDHENTLNLFIRSQHERAQRRGEHAGLLVRHEESPCVPSMLRCCGKRCKAGASMNP
jgi:hypothetical protein